MLDNRNRVFHYAVVASLALHGLLLVAFPEIVDTARRAASIPPQLIARLMEPEPAAPAPVMPEEKKPAAAVSPKKAEVVKPLPRVTKPVPESPAPVAREPSPEPAPPVEAPPTPAPVAPPVAAVEPQLAPSSPPAAVEAPESLLRDQYRLQLIDEAVRHKRYPPLARDNNWQGVVRVGVGVGVNGRPSVTLKGSSGYEVLDRQALEMFRTAARTVPIPPALRGKAFVIEDLPVRYNLED